MINYDRIILAKEELFQNLIKILSITFLHQALCIQIKFSGNAKNTMRISNINNTIVEKFLSINYYNY